MNLTNKTNGNFLWREAGNRLFIEIDGKPVELKYSLVQNEAYRALIQEDREKAGENAGKELDVAELLQMRITKSVEHALRVTEIAMNPKTEAQYSRDQVRDLFGEQLDLLQIVAHTWVDKKVFNPALSKVLDPHLAP
ncbi:MAG: hypothetical protein AB1403_00730 [Candidatus Riflebacteria bacterium]